MKVDKIILTLNRIDQTSGDLFAAQLRGFGFVGIFSVFLILITGNIILPNMVALPVGALLVLLWVKLSHTPWQSIGYAKPKSWPGTIVIGIIFGVALKFLMKAIVMPLLGADPVNQSYHFLAGNTAMLPAAIWAMLVAGFAEETVFRGYMFERLTNLLGESRVARISIVLVTSVLFGFSHYMNQGWPGVEQAIITGLVFGTIFSATKTVWLIMIAHSCFDLTALAMIYWNLECTIAHLVFE